MVAARLPERQRCSGEPNLQPAGTRRSRHRTPLFRSSLRLNPFRQSQSPLLQCVRLRYHVTALSAARSQQNARIEMQGENTLDNHTLCMLINYS